MFSSDFFVEPETQASSKGHEFCKIPFCSRRKQPNNYGFCLVHREYLSRDERKERRRDGIYSKLDKGHQSLAYQRLTRRIHEVVKHGEMPSVF